MPRDANGNYTLPSGNPVITNTLITSTWANDTMSDMANEMQDSLSRSGKGGFTAPVGIVDKSGSIPGLNFLAEPTSGFKREGSGDVRVQVSGQDNIRFLSTNRATDVWNNDLTTPAWERVFTTPTANVLDGNVEKTVQSKRETTGGVIPATLAEGELAVNIGDDPPKLFVGTAGGASVVPFIDADFVRFPSGTKMLFYQDTAPLGWTIDQTVDERMVRLTKGSVAGGQTGGVTGGTNNFSAQFTTINAGATALSVAQMPGHTHTMNAHSHTLLGKSGTGDQTFQANFRFAADTPGGRYMTNTGTNTTNTAGVQATTATMQSTGSGATHTHTVDLQAKWAACIIATKD